MMGIPRGVRVNWKPPSLRVRKECKDREKSMNIQINLLWRTVADGAFVKPCGACVEGATFGRFGVLTDTVRCR